MEPGVNAGTNGKATVLLADDHQWILDEASKLLESSFEVVGYAQNGQAALDLVESKHPDVLVTDINMPELDGIRLVQQLRAINSQVRVVFLTVEEDPEYVSAAFRLGAHAYVVKRRMNCDLTRAVEEVLAGRRFVSPPLC
jgi:DNA-binding NarL/FixJ family response regulator